MQGAHTSGVIFAFYLLINAVVVTFAAEWGYFESSLDAVDWATQYNDCAGDRQSPIDITTNDATFDPALEQTPLSLNGYQSASAGGALTMWNNGHGAMVKVNDDSLYSVSGSGLVVGYYLAQFHFHWGANSDTGSEHLIDGHQYPAEVHFVHVKSGLTIQQGLGEPDGIAVVGVMMQVPEGGANNSAFDELIQNLDEIEYKDDLYNISMTLGGLLPEDTSSYFRYNGSLTTPPCSEAVIWTVMKDPVNISESQMEVFRTLNMGASGAGGDIMVDNYRPVLPLGSRVVYKSQNFTAEEKEHEDIRHEWGYYNVEEEYSPSSWYLYWPDCAGDQQSPIDIDTGSLSYNPTLSSDPMVFHGYQDDSADLPIKMINNGHTLKFSVEGGLSVTGTGLSGTYNLIQFHFHWGESNTYGSEHTIDGNQYAAELHFVHLKEGYTVDDIHTVKRPDALAVVGVMIKVEGADNPAFDDIVNHLDNVAYPDFPAYNLTHFRLGDLLPNDKTTFYRYAGSLTTPTCVEVVTWTVFSEYIKMSQNQIDLLRTKLHHSPQSEGNASDYKLLDNHRLPQPLAGRTVYVSKQALGNPSGSATLTVSIFAFALAVLFRLL